MMNLWRGKKKQKEKQKEYETNLLRNGKGLLETSISLFNGKCNPIRIFSAEDLITATKNYDSQVLRYGGYNIYEGFIENRAISLKRYRPESWEYVRRDIFNDIVYSSKLSSHKSALKLIGCCLETQSPILVFEPVRVGTVEDHITGGDPTLLYRCRMKIAVDISHVIAYLHMAFDEPIVHRLIKLSNIFLDEHNNAKLSDFSLCISIPEGETHIQDDVMGFEGFISPEYMLKGRFNEKHDVYSFGACLLVLLTGKPVCYKYLLYSLADYVRNHIENNKLDEIVDPVIQEEGPWSGKEQQLKAFATIALKCVSESEEDRPTMMDVSKELRQMYRSIDSSQ